MMSERSCAYVILFIKPGGLKMLNNTFCNRKQIGFISIDTIPYRFTLSFNSLPALKKGNFFGVDFYLLSSFRIPADIAFVYLDIKTT